jgi:hypothetical protein
VFLVKRKVINIVCLSSGTLARRLLVCLSFFPAGDGGVRMCLRLAPAFAVARWAKDLFVMLITFKVLCTIVDDYQYIGGPFCKKENINLYYSSS